MGKGKGRGNSQCEGPEASSAWRITTALGGILAQEPLGLVPGQEFETGVGKICDSVLRDPEVA